MSRGELIGAAVALLIILALIVLLANAIRGQDVSWRMSYSTRRRAERRAAKHAALRQNDDEESNDG